MHPTSPVRLFLLRSITALAVGWGAASVGAQTTGPLPVVPALDLQRYSGDWYEIARLPNWFQRNCGGQVRARYGQAVDGEVPVLNQCRRADGTLIDAKGVARRVPRTDLPASGQLEVRFAPVWLAWLPVAWGDYQVLALDADYRISLVGAPGRDYLWLLARQPTLPEAEIALWLAKARALGFPTEQVVRTPQLPAVDAPTVGSSQ